MIEAEIHGKLGRSYSRAHDRAEDLLTSTAFGLLQYLPEPWGIHTLLRSARRVELISGEVYVRGGVTWLERLAEATCATVFWPSAGSYGQPDLLLTLARRDGTALAKVLIEVKFLSGKSSSADADSESDSGSESEIDPDQLVKYWQWLTSTSAPELPKAVVYLTAHAVPPVDDLRGTLVRAPTMPLGWLSWRDVWRVAHDCARATGSLPARDLARFLAHKGFGGFDGFHDAPGPLATALDTGSFWRRDRWFKATTLPNDELSCGGSFWREGRR